MPGGSDANPYDLTNVNGTLYFFARGPSDVGVSTDLWKSDGTAAGTKPIATFGGGNDLTLINGTVYFGATDPNDFTGALWRTDGTSAGTYAIRSFSGPTPSSITNVNGTLYFAAGSALWKSDGTAAGTVELTSSAGPNVYIGGIAAGNGGVYFAEGRSIWFTDGTPAGTRDVRDFPDGRIDALMTLNGQVYFGATDATLGSGLWTTDGTSAGTRLIAADATAIAGSAVLNNRLYFTADNAATGAELWASDGTPGGTYLVDDINPGPGDGSLGGVVAFNGAVYFSATDLAHGFQLWRSDGTAAGTAEVDQINTRPAGTFFGAQYDANATATIGGITYFAADDGVHGSELWRTDGTAAGTWMVDDIRQQGRDVGAGASNLFDFNGTLYFDVASGLGNDALFKSDGTAAGTTMVSAKTNAFDFTTLGDSLYFFSYDGSNYPNAPIDLMKLDAATGQVTTLMTVAPATSYGSANATGMGTLDGALYFGAIDASGHWTLWKTDGTASGTSEVMAFAGPVGVMAQQFLDVNGSLYFVANDGTNGAALWKTGGTAAATTMVWSPGSPDSTPANLYAFDDAVFFNVYTFQYGFFTSGVYRSDGTTAGTLELSTAATYQDPTFTTQGGKLYFLASTPNGRGAYTVFVTDGTPAGTMPVDAGLSVVPWNTPAGMLAVDGGVYFIASDGTHGNQLWQTDGVTTTLADPSETAAAWVPTALLGGSRNGLAFATDAAHGAQLWDLPVVAPAPATAAFMKSDSSTEGNWSGAYGSDGYAIANGATDLPSYVQLATGGASTWTWQQPSDWDWRTLQTGPGSTSRLAACDYSNGAFTYDLNLTDGQVHQVALYALNWDWWSYRNETITITDANTGAVLDSRNLANFNNGQWLVWNLSGHVNIMVTNNGGLNAVASGLFFGPPAASAGFVRADTTTQGAWTGVYGADGYSIFNGATNLPAYAQLTTRGASTWTWATARSTTDNRDLQTGPGAVSRIAACDYSDTSFTYDLNLTDGKAHQVALYAVNWDWWSYRNETITITDAATGAVLDSRNRTNFNNGQWLVWNLSGRVKITLTNNGGLNAVASGIFFG